MNPHHASNQNPSTASAVQQVNSVNNQQMCNGNVGGFPNNRPMVAPAGFMNFPNQPFPLQNVTGQFSNGGFIPPQNFNPYPVNQFNQQQQPQGQFFANNPMNPNVFNQNGGVPSEQVIMQSTIQNIYQLLQLQNSQNPNFAQAQRPPGNFPMFQNQIPNVMSQPNSVFPVNQQFGMSNPNVPMQQVNQGQPRFISPMMNGNASNQLPNMGQQLQVNPFLPHGSGPIQTQLPQNFPNQIGQGMVPQNPGFPSNQQFAMANPNGPMQNVNQGQQRFVSPMMDVNTLKQIPNKGDQESSILPNASEDKHGNANVNGGWGDSQRKNFTGHKKNDGSHKGFKSQFNHAKHGKEKFGMYNCNTSREGNNNAALNSGSRNSTKFEKKVPSLKYTDQEIKQWREARKKNFPTSGNVEKKSKKEETLADVTNQEAILRRQQLKEILEKQAELGCEVADIPSSYLSGSEKQINRGKKYERENYKKGKFNNNKRERVNKKTRRGDRDSFKANNNRTKERDPSLLQKLLTRDIKRDKNHILQALRFMAMNSFFSEESDKSLKFPNVIVKETNADVAEEIKAVDVKVNGEKLLDDEEEEGEITD